MLNTAARMTTAVLVFFILSVISAVAADIPLLYPLLLGSVLFGLLALWKGFSLSETLTMMLSGVRTGFLVFVIFVLMGLLTAAWRASGTIAFFVYWGVRLISPGFFLLYSFLIVSAVSYLMGSSFGAVGTLGVMLMVLAKSGGVPTVMAAGAIVGGSYIGDRCSPLSGSENLIAVITETDLSSNLRAALRTGLLPMLAASAFYVVLSLFHPLTAMSDTMFDEIAGAYNLSPLTALPALAVLVLPLFKCNIKLTIGTSLLLSCLLAVFLQNERPLHLLKQLVAGYEPTFSGVFAELIDGGGIRSTLNGALIVLVSSTYSGIFQKTGVLDGADRALLALARRTNPFFATVVASILTAVVACSQTLAVMLTYQMMRPLVMDGTVERGRMAQYLQNTAVTISPLIPWNIAVSVSLAILGADARCIPYAAYLYLVPLFAFLQDRTAAARKKGKRKARGLMSRAPTLRL